jgi:hypothetical protein
MRHVLSRNVDEIGRHNGASNRRAIWSTPEAELQSLAAAERVAILNAAKKLEALGSWAVAWAGPWAAGLVLMYLAYIWGQYPSADLTQTCVQGDCSLNFGEPAVVSWGELGICAAWLVLAAVMTRILARPPARGQDVPSSREARPQSLTSGDLQS